VLGGIARTARKKSGGRYANMMEGCEKSSGCTEENHKKRSAEGKTPKRGALARKHDIESENVRGRSGKKAS